MMEKNDLGGRYTWRGPTLSSDSDTLLLAMILRAYNSMIKGVPFDYQPSVVTNENISVMAVTMFVFKKKFKDLLRRDITSADLAATTISLDGMTESKIKSIRKSNKRAVNKIERELRGLICTEEGRGFVCYGG